MLNTMDAMAAVGSTIRYIALCSQVCVMGSSSSFFFLAYSLYQSLRHVMVSMQVSCMIHQMRICTDRRVYPIAEHTSDVIKMTCEKAAYPLSLRATLSPMPLVTRHCQMQHISSMGGKMRLTSVLGISTTRKLMTINPFTSSGI